MEISAAFRRPDITTTLSDGTISEEINNPFGSISAVLDVMEGQTKIGEIPLASSLDADGGQIEQTFRLDQFASKTVCLVPKVSFTGDIREDQVGIAVVNGYEVQESRESTPELAKQEVADDDLSVYPNPFNPSTTINYDVIATGLVRLSIFDILGREVAILVNEEKAPGLHRAIFDASRLPSGIYFSRLDVQGKSIIRKLLLLK